MKNHPFFICINYLKYIYLQKINIMDEIWLEIPNFNGFYQASNKGNFKSVDRIILYKNGKSVFYRGKELKTQKLPNGYHQLKLRDSNGKQHYLYAHRIVATLFVKNDDPEHKTEVNHIDENKSNNCASNLEWCDHKYNNEYSNIIEKNFGLTKIPVEAYKDGELVGIFESQSEAARLLGINSRRVSDIIKGKRKTHKGFTFKFHKPE